MDPVNKPVDRRDLYEMLREQIKHEDELVSQRLNWFLVLQGFLFVAFTTILTSDKVDEEYKLWLLIATSVFGFAAGFLTFLSVSAAFFSLKILHEVWCNGECTPEKMKYKTGGLPPVTYIGKWYASAINAGAGLPLLVLSAWSGLLMMALWKDYTSWSLLVLIIGAVTVIVSAFLFLKEVNRKPAVEEQEQEQAQEQEQDG